MFLSLWNIGLIYIFLPFFINSSKINVPRVLLPYNHDIPSNYTLKVHDGGCYKWSSSRDEVILEVITVDGCSTEAVVSAVTRSPARLTAIILAKDIATGFLLRCDIIVDSIDHLEIVTTTRELYAEEAPEAFEVRAYDHQGNEFTSLEGQTFIWNLETITDHKSVVPAQTVLRFILFEEFPYETPPAIAPLEARGERGYMVLIEGRQTGLARLSVRMAHPAYKTLLPAEVNLMVIANLILEPQDVYVLPQTTIEYSVFHMKQGVLHPVQIGGSQYSLQISDGTIASLEQDGVSVTGITHGTTLVILHDKNVKSSETLKQPTASFHVVDPSYLTITIFPHNNPVLTVGEAYTFVVRVYDKHNNKIHVSDSIVIETVVPSEFIRTQFVTRNGSHVEGIPVHKGTTKISATLAAIEVGDEVLQISPPLKASLSLDIYDRIRVQPRLTLLPWDPVTKPQYALNLTVEGAYGSVLWSSSEASLVEVNTLGQCGTRGEGKATVKAALAINPHNNDDADIYVEEVLELNFVDGVREVEVDRPLPVFVSMHTLHEGSRVFFTQCHQLPLRFNIQEASFSSSELKTSSANDSCLSVEVSSAAAGFSRVTLAYDSAAGNKGDLEDSTTLGVFNPLRPLSPESEQTLLALGTSRVVLFQGGPLPWVNKPAGHFTKVQYNESCLSVEVLGKEGGRSVHGGDVHALHVECRHDVGEFNVKIRVGNKPSNSLPFPVQARSSMKVICGLPDIISLSASASVIPGCSANRDSHTAPCTKPVPLELTVLDSEGRSFDNVSSLSVEWTVGDSALASVPSTGRETGHTPVHDNTVTLHGYRVPVKSERNLLVPAGLPGEVSVTSSIRGFRVAALRSFPVPPLQDSITVRLVQDAELNPRHLVLFNHKENKGEIRIVGGSGQFELKKEDKGVAVFELSHDKIIVSPLANGNTSVTLVDRCLEPAVAPSASVRISSLGSLDLFVDNRMEVGSVTEAEVVATDTFGSHVPMHALMKLTPHPQSSIIAVTFASVNAVGNAVFRVGGSVVGETSLKMSAHKGTATLYSHSKPVQVFPSLRIQPRNVTLVVGAVFQVETTGGPYPDSTIEYVMENETVSSVSHAGVVTAVSLGASTLSAVALSQHKDGQRLLVRSKDFVSIRVVALESIRIHAPLRHIETGCAMPLYALGGLEDPQGAQTPLAFATAVPPLLFEWTLNNKQIAAVKTLYSENEVLESKENQGIVRLKALRAGRVTVTLKVSVTHPHADLGRQQVNNNVVLTDKIEINVFESLKLKEPKTEDAKILLAPNAETKILTNRESEGKLSFRAGGSCSLEGGPSPPLIEVSPEGVVRAGLTPGDASVTVTLEEDFGVTQTIVLLVEVRPVMYIQGSASPFMRSSWKNALSALPAGLAHDLRFTFHDNRGRHFTATDSRLRFRPSRFDLLNVRPGPSNDSLSVAVRDGGQTVIHVWDDANPFVSDFVKINSGAGITPDKVSVPVGSFVCLSSPVRSASGGEGVWRSDSNALEIDPATGVGVARHVGKVAVSYQVSPAVGATTEVFVTPVKNVSLDMSPHAFTNARRDSAFIVGVSLEGEGGGSSPSCWPPAPSLQPHLPFTCVLSFSPALPGIEVKNVVSATATYVPEQGFGCVLEGVVDSDAVFATSGVGLRLGVSVAKGVSQEGVEALTVDVPFYPGVFLEKEEVLLTDQEAEAAVMLRGSRDLVESFQVCSEAKGVDVRVEMLDDTSGQLVLSAREALWAEGAAPLEPVSVALSSSITQQKIQVVARFEQIGSSTCAHSGGRKVGLVGALLSLLSRYQHALLSVLGIVVTVVCLLFGYSSLVSPGYKQTQNVTVFASSPAPPSSPLTSPSVGSASSPGGFSPRFRQSPQGISLWSVDQEPVYGDPLFRSSPRAAYENSPTYSRTMNS